MNVTIGPRLWLVLPVIEFRIKKWLLIKRRVDTVAVSLATSCL